jgi:AraC-like DNA-binding protein
MLLNLPKTRRGDVWRFDARIHSEPEFRYPTIIRESDNLARRVVVSRWAGRSEVPREHRAEILDEYHTIGVSMVPTQLRLSVSERTIFEGTLEPGSVQLSGPGQPLSIQTSGSYDWIHVHIGNSLLRGCQALLPPGGRNGPLIMKQESPFRDPVIHYLVNSLVNMSEPPTPISHLCGESIILAIVSRVLGRRSQLHFPERAPRANPLIAWRLKRVKEFVAERLADPITLADLGQAAGLTRMHFAAQFRAATGLRPHDYVLQQRIARAKELLLNTDLKLAEIALAVGFQGQAHFTTVFSRIALATPRRWRCRERTVQEPRCAPPIGRSQVEVRNTPSTVHPATTMLSCSA